MDVTHGLISRLVKSKSTERVLAPIASQVSTLCHFLSSVSIRFVSLCVNPRCNSRSNSIDLEW